VFSVPFVARKRSLDRSLLGRKYGIVETKRLRLKIMFGPGSTCHRPNDISGSVDSRDVETIGISQERLGCVPRRKQFSFAAKDAFARIARGFGIRIRKKKASFFSQCMNRLGDSLLVLFALTCDGNSNR